MPLIIFKNRARKKALAILRSIRHSDDDILTPEQKDELNTLISEGDEAKKNPADFVNSWQQRLEKILPPRKMRWLREWVDIILVVGAVAFGIRGLFFQPFRIPTGSMQPTLFGIHYIDHNNHHHSALGHGKFTDLLLGGSKRAYAKNLTAGRLNVKETQTISDWFLDETRFTVAGTTYTLPGSKDKVADYTGLKDYVDYPPGEIFADGFLSIGDFLFVERASLYFREPERGDVIVFNTDDISIAGRPLSLISGQYYIKRLVGLPGDTLRFSEAGLEVKPRDEAEFRHIKSFSKKFDKLYSGQGGYQKHSPFVDRGIHGTYLRDFRSTYTVADDEYFVLGDNVAFSSDSRFFGGVPRRNLVGRAWLVFWPFSRRWGQVDRLEPLPEPTGKAINNNFESMEHQ